MVKFDKINLVPYGDGYVLSSSTDILNSAFVHKGEVVLVSKSDVYKFGDSGLFVKITIEKPSISEKNKEMYIVLSGDEKVCTNINQKNHCVLCGGEITSGIEVEVNVDYIVEVQSSTRYICDQCYTTVIDWRDDVLSEERITDFVSTII